MAAVAADAVAAPTPPPTPHAIESSRVVEIENFS